MVYPNRILALLLLVAASAARATGDASFTGEDLLQGCVMAEQEMNGATLTRDQGEPAMGCISYIAGVRDTITLYPPTNKGKQLICIPKDQKITGGQLVRVVLKWLRDHPEELNMPRVVTVLEALRDTWPCRTAQK
jgi:hypothetical protein